MITKKLPMVDITSMRDTRTVYKDPTPALTFNDQQDHYKDIHERAYQLYHKF